jgi:hypothetical protein
LIKILMSILALGFGSLSFEFWKTFPPGFVVVLLGTSLGESGAKRERSAIVEGKSDGPAKGTWGKKVNKRGWAKKHGAAAVDKMWMELQRKSTNNHMG